MTYILCTFGEGYPESDPQVHKLEDLIISEDNNGTKAAQYKANIVDQNGMNYVATTLPKTTKNNISKFYTEN